MKSTPTLALGALAGVEPLHLTTKAVAANAAKRMNMELGGRMPTKLRIPTDIVSRLTLSMIRDKTPLHYLFEQKYLMSLSTREEWATDEACLPSDGYN